MAAPSSSDFRSGRSLHAAIDSKVVDFGKASEDYGRHRPGFPDSFYRRVVDRWLDVKRLNRTPPQQQVERAQLAGGAPFLHDYFAGPAPEDAAKSHFSLLDLGAGPGIVGLRMAQLFPNCQVVGVDISPQQIQVAQQRSRELGLDSRCSWHVATAEETRVPDHSVDIVVAGSSWHWFKHDLAMKEVHRVLKPEGILAIGTQCYLPRRSQMVLFFLGCLFFVLELTNCWKGRGHGAADPQVQQDLADQGRGRPVPQPRFIFAALLLCCCAGLGSWLTSEHATPVDQLVLEGNFNLVEQVAYDVAFPPPTKAGAAACEPATASPPTSSPRQTCAPGTPMSSSCSPPSTQRSPSTCGTASGV